MILEGIVTTVSAAGDVNIAPMGPHVAFDPETGELTHCVLRPFRTSQTCANLQTCGYGVLHVTDDVLVLARSALGSLDPPPQMRPATRVQGWVLTGACRYHEFRVLSCDDQAERARFEVEVVHTGQLRDFFGWNRAKRAVVEAAILATRTAFLPLEEIEAEYGKLAALVEKTGGPQEHTAFAFLRQHLESIRRLSGS